MAIKITDDCINCGACEVKCPNKAIYEGGKEWSFSYGTPVSEFRKNDGSVVLSEELQPALSESVYYIVTEKCTECVGFHDEPQCISVCPVDCCVPDEKNRETRSELEVKKENIRIK
jgi:ferredoxin